MVRLWKRYKEEIVPKMAETFALKNTLRVPRLEKIVVNMGIGEGVADSKAIQAAQDDLAIITGQRPSVTKAKKSVASFKVRQGMAVGCKVTLRGKMMYEFLDRLINIVLPRIKDFRGMSPDSFDGYGNYSFGLEEQVVFPEIEIDNVYRVQGMDITLVTNQDSDREAKELLRLFGFPFQHQEG